MLSSPLIRCGDKIFDSIIKQEIIDGQEFDGNVKEEITDETEHNNDSQMLRTRYEYSLLFCCNIKFDIRYNFNFDFFFKTCTLFYYDKEIVKIFNKKFW